MIKLLNYAIVDFIKNCDDFDEEVKRVLIETLKLEINQSGAVRYFNDYDKILTKIIKD